MPSLRKVGLSAFTCKFAASILRDLEEIHLKLILHALFVYAQGPPEADADTASFSDL